MEKLEEILKKEFEGERIKEIKNKKQIIVKGAGLKILIKSTKDLKINEFILVPKSQMILPEDNRNVEMSPLKFKKTFKTINLSNFSKKEYIEKKMTPKKLIFDKMSKAYNSQKKDFSRRGISWTGMSDNRKRFYSFSHLRDGWEKVAIMLKFGIDPSIKNYSQKAVCKIISKSNEEIMRTVSIDSIPIDTQEEVYFSQWANLNAKSDSPEEPYRALTHKYVSRQVFFGSEMIAAYILRAITDKVQKNRGKMKIMKFDRVLLNPFLAYTKIFFDIYRKFNNNILITYTYEGKDKIRKPNQAEKDNLSSWLIAELKPKKCFRYNERFTKEFIKDVSSYIIKNN